ncbi:hypothetical protein IC610_14835 [Chryseobacterium sp. GCR10]|uniref:Uncharacterized protein n=2 Tax=Chryseobacterium caseinilyticum TaxID=2771428 RepID=A0ABR8ZEG3_9FLAO|nr:hypothetical protein [Chryseobacterium caseinilyticum]
MNWDFEDFLQKAEGNAELATIIPIQNKKPSFPKWFWMAASAVIVLGLTLIFSLNKNTVAEQENLVKNEVLKQKNEFVAENHEHENQVAVHYSDSVSGEKRDSVFVENTVAENDVLDEILSKKARMKKQIKPKFVQNVVSEDSSGYRDSYVIVNGRKISSEKEAMDVTTFSLMKMGKEFRKTVASFNKDEGFTEEY